MYLVSACLAGYNCRYDAQNRYNEKIADLVRTGQAIPICPEILGGLPTPREPMKIHKINNSVKVLDSSSNDLTNELLIGANKCLELARLNNITVAILKQNSPSCGYNSNNKIDGITSTLLSSNGIKILNESNFLDYI